MSCSSRSYSVCAVSCSPTSALCRVCQASVAHLTRAGNSLTPESTSSLPKSRAGSAASRPSVSSACRRGTAPRPRRPACPSPPRSSARPRRWRWRSRGRRSSPRARCRPRPAGIDGELVAAQRVVAVGVVAGGGQRAVVPRVAVAGSKITLVQLAQRILQVVHAALPVPGAVPPRVPNSACALWIAATSASRSASPLYRPSEARAVPGMPKRVISGIAQW